MVLDRFVYVFIVFGNDICLINTGVAAGKDIIFDYIKKQDRSPQEIKKIVITHSHPDHIGALKLIKEETNCEVPANEKRKAWIEDTDLQFKERPVPGFNELVAGSCKIDKFLSDGDICFVNIYIIRSYQKHWWAQATSATPGFVIMTSELLR